MPATPRSSVKPIGDEIVPRLKPESIKDVSLTAEKLEVEYGKK